MLANVCDLLFVEAHLAQLGQRLRRAVRYEVAHLEAAALFFDQELFWRDRLDHHLAGVTLDADRA